MSTLEDTGLEAIDHAITVSATKSQSNSRARTSYKVYTPKGRYQIGKYSSESGPAANVRKFKIPFPNLNKSTVRGFPKKYQETLRSAVRTVGPRRKRLVEI